MAAKATRRIVYIDEEKCDGCGLCIPSCAEGAIEIVDGKARLSAENLCDGLGNCLGVCPQDAIVIEEREADDFDEAAVEQHLAETRPPKPAAPKGCPGAMLRKLSGQADAVDAGGPGQPSALQQWPIQLTLLPEKSDIWDGADVLLAADCAAFSLADFHKRLLAGRTLAIACPKLDDVEPYIAKLAAIFTTHNVRSVTVARMEVPCCQLDAIARKALAQAGKDTPLTVVTVGISGQVIDVNGTLVSP
ncbi:MAG: ATP-binding protein [Planctomycetota bacterium]|jgi:Fe-S-cluster-containing hydrogenase component 2